MSIALRDRFGDSVTLCLFLKQHIHTYVCMDKKVEKVCLRSYI